MIFSPVAQGSDKENHQENHQMVLGSGDKPKKDQTYLKVEALQAHPAYDTVCQTAHNRDNTYLSKKVTGFPHSIVFMDTYSGERHPFILGNKLGQSNNVVRRAI